MERFAALVTGHQAAHVPAPAPAAKRKGKVVEEDAAYLSIQLEEIVIVKNDDDAASLGAARGRSTLSSGAPTSMGQRVPAVAAPPSGMTYGGSGCRGPRRDVDDRRIVGSDGVVGRVGELRSRVFV